MSAPVSKVKTSKASAHNNEDSSSSPSMLQIGMGLLIVGASAGLTLYTKKTQSLLNQMKRVKKNKEMRLPKKKYGPMTKNEYERMRPRWTDDDL